MELRHREAGKRASKWVSLGERVAMLEEGESIILEPEGDPAGEASKIRNALNGLRVCRLTQRKVQVVEGKIIITRVGCWPMLSAFRHTLIPLPGRS
jgi:hypothetical protein